MTLTTRTKTVAFHRVCLGIVFILGLLSALVPADAAFGASKVDAAKATARQIRAELEAVTTRLERQQAQSAAARQAAVAAQGGLRAARAAEATVKKRLERVRGSVREAAIREYMLAGPRNRQFVGTADASDLARADYLQGVAMGSTRDLEDELDAARADSQAARARSEAAVDTAKSRQRTASQAVDALRASRDRQFKLAAAAEARVDAAVKESEAQRRVALRASRSVSQRGASPRGSSQPGAVGLTTVRGITVSTQIAGNLERLLAAADADGRRFGGSGYRSSEGQVAARRSNCGTSNYDVYEKPASQCSPPTARPGQSMHEQGLAIDFTYNGSLIQSRSSEGFQWLKANAASFGFYNLPAESWHWSVNGN